MAEEAVKEAPTEYRAFEEYQKTTTRNRPGNIPAHLMKQAMAESVNRVLDQPNMGVNGPSSIDIVRGWASKQKDQKQQEILGLTDIGMIRTLLQMEDDEDLQELLIARKRELKPI